MRKFTSLMLMLLCAVTTMWAFTPEQNITDLSSLQDGEYVLLRNVGRNKYLHENADKRIITGANAESLAYVWRVHKEEDKYSFSSYSGLYISTPLDGGDVYTVASDDQRKDKFTITEHEEDDTKWKLQSTNNPNIYWDAQDQRFVGWRGTGANSRYEIITIEISDEEIENIAARIKSAELDNARAAVSSASNTKVGAYTIDAVANLSEALAAYEADMTSEKFDAAKAAYEALLANGKRVELADGDIFTVKCLDTNRGYMVYSTVEGMGSETQAYLAGTNRTEYHASIDADGIYKEWAVLMHEGKTYMYNVQNKKFINAENVVKFTDNPVAFNFVDIGNALWEIQFESNSRYLSFSPGWGANCVRTEPGIDDGCKFYIELLDKKVSAETLAVVEKPFVDEWRNALVETLGYVGGYSLSAKDALESVSTLADANEFEKNNQKVAVNTNEYYRLVCVSPKTGNNGDDSYRTLAFNGLSNLVTTPENSSNINQIFKFEDAGDGKLYLKNLNADGYLNKINVGTYRASIVTQADACKLKLQAYDALAQWKLNNSEGSSLQNLFAENHPTENVPYACAGWDDGANSASAWYIIPATTIEVTVNEFASIYLPFNVEMVEGVKAYAIETVNGEYAVMAEKSDIMAGEGAILSGKGNFTLDIVNEVTSNWENNLLKGTTMQQTITKESGSYYVLANGNNGIGFYSAKNGDDMNTFINAANKAYLHVPAAAGSAEFYGFNFDGTTAIEGVEVENVEKVIYDLTGRRIEKITKAGIYIVNGNKVLVK